ncbi:MAG: leucine-rich repeat domain-containing protein [Clostridia bacterium]|nr:leucine-rich repeat domain-containing protein [Clostridia bacterium]
MHRRLLAGGTLGMLAVLLALFMAAGVAEEERTDASGQWKYVLEEACATITGYVEEPGGDLVIPGEVDGFAVTAVGEDALLGCVDLTGVTFPDGLVSIGEGAFYDCESLVSVIFPDGLHSIGDYAFMNCGRLVAVAFPDSLAFIGDRAFANCESLPGAAIPKSVVTLGANPFYGGGAMKRIDVAADNPEYVSVDGVLFDKEQKTLVAYPAGKPGKAYAIPQGVLHIGENAFTGCSGLTAVTFPDSLLSIGESAFASCGLISVALPKGMTSISDWTFSDCRGLTGVTFPGGLVSIGEAAFFWCASLTEVSFPDGLVSIGKIGSREPFEFGAFQSSGLTRVFLPDGLQFIGNRTFKNCANLSGAFIPDSVTDIGEDAFVGCGALAIFAAEGCFAEQYAKENGIPYVILD